jgi:predicted N-formylglutamate amidohydrolase
MSQDVAANRIDGAPGVEASGRLLAPDEPAPFDVVNAAGTSAFVLVCDHASNRVPRSLSNLGLRPDQLAGHIAWDPGAATVARGLSARLDAPLILGGWSRLVIDLNRPLASPESIPEESDHVPVPGNLGLGGAERARRISALFEPYHLAVAALLEQRGPRTRLLSIHSFTPALDGQQRPWHVGVASGTDRRLVEPLLRALRRHRGLCVGDNEPYDVDHAFDYTLPTHGEGRGLPHAMIEIRQDQLGSAAASAAWIARLADSIESSACGCASG